MIKPMEELAAMLEKEGIRYEIYENWIYDVGFVYEFMIPSRFKPGVIVACDPGSDGYPYLVEVVFLTKSLDIRETKGWRTPEEALRYIKKETDHIKDKRAYVIHSWK